jgi:hypothetical protein
MTLERQQRVISIHAASIINHANERNSPAANQNLDLARAGIDAVFNQFLRHGTGALDYFASRDLAGNGVWEQSDSAHSILNLSFRLMNCEGKHEPGKSEAPMSKSETNPNPMRSPYFDLEEPTPYFL